MKGRNLPLLYLGLIINICTVTIHAQTSISGVVLDNKGVSVPYANVLILTTPDSTLWKGGITGEDGNFQINTIVPGSYILKVAMVGFQPYTTSAFSIENGTGSKDFGTITLEEDAVLMNEVQVVAKKPLFEQKIDRMVVNVANSITSSGTNALEVLERSPGVLVNRQSNAISLSGKSGVIIMINGRINYLPAEAVTALLEGMSSDNIERIEIITTPPAGFDAEGNAGYINIVLRKNIDDGFNGSYAFSLGYGKGGVGTANLNVNYRKGKSNLYGDVSYLYENQSQLFSFYKSLFLDGQVTEIDSRSNRDPTRNNYNARLGWDYELSPQTILGVLVSGYDTKWTMDALNESRFSKSGVLDTFITIDNYELNQWKHLGGNLNLQHTFSEGCKLTFDADYLWYKDNNPTDYDNRYEDGLGNPLFENFTRSRKLTPIRIKVGKLDYQAPVGSKIRMEAGIKATDSNFTNDVGVEYRTGADWYPDPDLTAKYELEEKIFAGYVSFDFNIGKKTSIKAGLRYEYTDSNLGSAEQDNIVDREFGDWFPTFYVSRTLNEHNSVNFSYGKRITRPTFNDMAPFVIFQDPYTLFSGNAALQPAVAHNFELGYRYKSALVSMKYSVEDSSIANYQSTIIAGTNKQLIFSENLKSVETYSLTLSFPVTPFKWWSMYYNFGAVYQKIEKYDHSSLITFEAGSANIFSSQTFTLPSNFTFEITGFYGSGGLFGAYLIRPFGAVNMGIQKKFGENGGALRLGYDDVFNTLAFKSHLELEAQDQVFDAYLEFNQPTIKLTYTRNFGNQKMKGNRKRATGSEEERRRISN